MHTKMLAALICLCAIILPMISCGPGSLFAVTLAPTPTFTPIPIPAPTPTLAFDPIAEINGRFWINKWLLPIDTTVFLYQGSLDGVYEEVFRTETDMMGYYTLFVPEPGYYFIGVNWDDLRKLCDSQGIRFEPNLEGVWSFKVVLYSDDVRPEAHPQVLIRRYSPPIYIESGGDIDLDHKLLCGP